MQNNIIELLELDKTKAEAGKYAATSMGREIIRKLKPLADRNLVERILSEVAAAKKIIDEEGVPPFGGVRELRDVLKKVAKEIVLSKSELMDVRNTLGACKALRAFFDNLIANLDPRIIENYLSLVTEKGEKIVPLPDIESELDRCFDEYGEIKDSASSELARIRSEMVSNSNEVRNKMESVIRSKKYSTMLQDTLVIRRGDRFVVPVKSEYRNIFEGIIHDQSASGLTVYMEPLAVVRLNNRLRELKNKEEKEVYKILQQLTYLIQGEVGTISQNQEIITELDSIFARAEYSQKIGGIAPEINEQGRINIRGGRHPLLGKEAVAIDISAGEDFRTLVITGPNTGGKTVSLKTIGLFILMVESGFHIPAKRGTELSVFKKVFVDVGDEQSIEQNLSTFSSHIHRIKSFLEEADKDSLVLMDELGVGTDPREGAALGISILEDLRTRETVTVATTHYSQLKNYAYNREGVENASMEFDLETLKPTYKVLMGIPGGSYAFAIARRLGIPEGIVAEARELISGEELEIENIIDGLNTERKKHLELKREYEIKEREARKLKEKYEKMLADMEKEEDEIIRGAREEAGEIIEDARRRSKEILKDLKEFDFKNRSEIDRKGTEIHEKIKHIEED